MSSLLKIDRLVPEDIQGLHPIQYEGPIHLIQEEEKLERVLDSLKGHEEIGLDTEKRPSFKKGQHYPLSLLQLATHDNVYLIQLQKTGIISSLKDFLSSDKVKKVGIALHDDVKELQKLSFFNPSGFINLDQIAKEKGILQTGARSLTARFLGKKLCKACQKSNWGLSHLTEKQKIYAATDAWICLQIYPHLKVFTSFKND